MGGKSSQAKGRRGEKELAGVLKSYGFNAVVGDPVNFGKMPDLYGVDGVHIECKRAERIRLSEWMTQAIEDAQRFGDGCPIVFHRRSREEWLCTMRLSDFVELYRKGGNTDDAGADRENESNTQGAQGGAAETLSR